jgi:hypothetical protein
MKATKMNVFVDMEQHRLIYPHEENWDADQTQ